MRETWHPNIEFDEGKLWAVRAIIFPGSQESPDSVLYLEPQSMSKHWRDGNSLSSPLHYICQPDKYKKFSIDVQGKLTSGI